MKARHWSQLGENTFVAGIWLLYGVHRLLGRWPFRLCLYPVVAGYWLTRPDVRRASLTYLRRLQESTGALGEDAHWRHGLRHVQRFAETLLDKLLAVSGRFPFDTVQLEGRDDFDAQTKDGQGGVLVTAHVGCLELCRVMAKRGERRKLTVLVHTAHAERFNQILKRLEPESGVQLLEVTHVDAATALMLSERVKAGEWVVIAGDRVPVRSARAVSVPFLGKQAPFPVGPYVLAALFQCPLYLLVCFRAQAQYVLHFERLAERVQLSRKNREGALVEYARLYADRLTLLLQRAPYDWFNFFPFWEQADALSPTHR